MLRDRRLILIVVGMAAISSLSCSGYRGPKLPPKKPVVPVSGKVHVDGKPAAGVLVTLQPKGPSDGLFQYPAAVTDAEGQFKLGTYAKDDGAPAGEYAAVFVWPLPVEEQTTEVDKLKRLYDNTKKSKFAVTVTTEPLTLDTFDLKVAGMKFTPLTKEELVELNLRKQQQSLTKPK